MQATGVFLHGIASLLNTRFCMRRRAALTNSARLGWSEGAIRLHGPAIRWAAAPAVACAATRAPATARKRAAVPQRRGWAGTRPGQARPPTSYDNRRLVKLQQACDSTCVDKQHDTTTGRCWRSRQIQQHADLGSCRRHISAARSQACHMGCWCVGGSRGWDVGVQFAPRMIRSASR